MIELESLLSGLTRGAAWRLMAPPVHGQAIFVNGLRHLQVAPA